MVFKQHSILNSMPGTSQLVVSKNNQQFVKRRSLIKLCCSKCVIFPCVVTTTDYNESRPKNEQTAARNR